MSTSEINSADKFDRHNSKLTKFQVQKNTITSFLDGFTQLTEDDMEILAEYEEEQARRGHFQLLFPTRETVDSLGPYFECQRHANLVLWQYIRQK